MASFSIPFFEWFNKILLQSANSIPIQSLWVAFITNPILLNKAFQTGMYENGGFKTLTAGAALNSSSLGLLFANAVTIPGEGMEVSKYGPEQTGIIKGNISSGRKDLQNLSVSFLDTNLSFTDYNIRPWIIYANHKSLKDPSIKTSFNIIQFAKTGPRTPLIPRAIWTFYDACPVSISSEDWNYAGDNVISRTVEFAYNYYTLNAEPGITAVQSVASVFINSSLKMQSQPISIEKGGLIAHSGSQKVSVPSKKTTADGHSKGQPVVIPEDDMVSRGINIGLDILNGSSNVKISSDDVVNELKKEGQAILNMLKSTQVKVEGGDIPLHNPENFVLKEPVGPNGEEPGRIIRKEQEREPLTKIPTGGKSDLKKNTDTPLFFPGDGGEGSIKIQGKTVTSLDTPQGNRVPNQLVVINKNDSSQGRSLETKIIPIERNGDTSKGITSNSIVIERNGNSSRDVKGDSIIVPRTGDTSYGVTNKQRNINNNDVVGSVNSDNKEVSVTGNPGSSVISKQVPVEKTGDVGINIPIKIITIKQDDHIERNKENRNE